MSNVLKSQQKLTGFRGSLVIPGGRVGVLLIHSLGGNPLEMRFVAQSVAREGCTVYCPLLPGLGGGTDVSGLSTWRDWDAAAEKALEDLKAHCDTILVGGMSAGSMVALRLARNHPETVRSLVLFAPTLSPNGWTIPWTFNLFRLVQQKWVARLFQFRQRAPFGIKDERIRNFVFDSYKSDDRPIEDLFGRGGGLVYEFLRLSRDVKKGLSKISQSTLIFHPRQDDQSNLSNALLLQRRLSGLVETVVLDDCYHMVTLDKQRNLVADRTVEFVQRQLRGLEEREAAKRWKDAQSGEQQAQVLAGEDRSA
jgi:carboxylesterase